MISNQNISEACHCGAKTYNFLYQESYNRQVENFPFTLFQCKQCQTVRIYRIPGITFYTEGYTASTGDNKSYVPRDKPWCHDLVKEASDLLGKRPHLKKSPILDVGCNGGELVNLLIKAGHLAEGCDIDPVAVGHGQSQGLPLFIKNLSEEDLEKKYGLIILNHTLEHIVPINAFVRAVHAALVDDGLILIHVPNYAGWISKIMRHKWGFLAPHEHVWQFTPKH